MRLTLLAFTAVTPMFLDRSEELDWEGTSSRPGELLIEFAGRSCYQSWHKPNPKTANTDDYITNIERQKHFSVIEHASVTFYLEDVSRSLTHELVRHRHFSFSQLSQRYAHPSAQQAVIPPLFRGHEMAERLVSESFERAVKTYDLLIEIGERDFGKQSRKQVREAARSVLPNATPTSIVVTGNYRSWLEFVEKRDSPAADREIAEAAAAIHRELEKVAPAVFPRTAVTLSEQMAPAFDPPAIQPEYPEGSVGAP